MNSYHASGTASVTHRPGAVILDPAEFNLLVHLGLGRGDWLEDGTASVADVARAVVGGMAEGDAARHFGTTVAHVRQAMLYAGRS
jgi:hypothetical protein